MADIRLRLLSSWSLFLALMLSPTICGQGVRDVESEVASVTAYRDRAAVTRRATLNLGRGQHVLRFPSLPSTLDPMSVQVGVDGPGQILTVEQAQGGPSDPGNAIDQEIDAIQSLLGEIADELESVERQLAFLDRMSDNSSRAVANAAGSGAVDLEGMQEQLAFVGEESLRLLARKRELSDRYLQREAELDALRQRQPDGGQLRRRHVIVSMHVEQAGPLTVELDYLVAGARWTPSYNFRSDLGQAIVVEYDAVLVQNTGEDWTDVALTLATTRPGIAANPPTIEPWFVDVLPKSRKTVDRAAATFGTEGVQVGDDAGRRSMAHGQTGFEIIGEGPAVSYRLPDTVTVETTSLRTQRTRIATLRLPAQYVHVASPLLTESVYLRADLINQSPLHLLAGSGSVFLGGEYIGPMHQEHVVPNGRFSLYCGVDPAVTGRRVMVQKSTSTTGLFGGGRRTDFDYRIDVSNATGRTVELELWDRRPVSRSDEIKIDLLELSTPLANDAAYVEEELPQGLLKWRLSLPPGMVDANAFVLTWRIRVDHSKDASMTPLPD